MPTLAVLTAAGSGTRLGLDVPKALVEVDGLPLVVHAARNLCASGVVDEIVVTCPAGLVDHVDLLLRDDPGVDRPVRAVVGGGTRQESVEAGLRAGLGRAAGTDSGTDSDAGAGGAAGVDVVVVHDAARPAASPDLVRRVVAAVRSGHVAVVPGLPVVDTIKRVEPGADGVGAERVTATVDRDVLRAVQTPQAFDRGVLQRAHAESVHRAGSEHLAATDDAGLVEDLGLPVHVVPGEVSAAKITTAEDLHLARWRAGHAATRDR
ncbi:2-C-methyl-D-erythritol 4-phosphate cytidylyltransferase [Isoptericola jiangsuensis]|uniref:2-C-methyl-D-erythritol 4-phosphate cytidylyltransferase n=1 Tax=Isoptericola jiangsuensis TaxID=548579 RepID=UPI003AB089E9